MTRKDIAKQYIAYLQDANTTKIIDLFSDKGIVDSPLYGLRKASDFYNVLANDTSNSELSIKGIFEDNDLHQIALYFTYTWTLKNNETVRFDVVDIIEFNTDDKISKLTIIYDTIVARLMLQKQKG